MPGWPGNDPGQHVDIRLTAEDGYQAVRSYSLGSYGAGETIELAVDEIPDGEVSPYLVRDVLPGDELEVKGPLGGYFVWRPGGADPVQLIAGGSGIVPLMAMARATSGCRGRRRRSGCCTRCARRRTRYIAMSSLGLGEAGGVDVTWAYTRAAPAGLAGTRRTPRRRGDRGGGVAAGSDAGVYVCGPTGFVEHVADTLVELGHDAAQDQDRTLRRCVMRAENAAVGRRRQRRRRHPVGGLRGRRHHARGRLRRMRRGRAARRGGRRARRGRRDRALPRLHAHARDGAADADETRVVIGTLRELVDRRA